MDLISTRLNSIKCGGFNDDGNDDEDDSDNTRGRVWVSQHKTDCIWLFHPKDRPIVDKPMCDQKYKIEQINM